jgi:hypothetical protein
MVVKDRIRKSQLISAIGLVILFGSIDISVLQYRLYPPFGLVTQAFMSLRSYMLFIGIFTSAIGVVEIIIFNELIATAHLMIACSIKNIF